MRGLRKASLWRPAVVLLLLCVSATYAQDVKDLAAGAATAGGEGLAAKTDTTDTTLAKDTTDTIAKTAKTATDTIEKTAGAAKTAVTDATDALVKTAGQAKTTATDTIAKTEKTDATDADVKTGQALTDAIEANSEAQDYNEDTEVVKAQVVKEEPAVEIASGTGDVDTTGACKAEVDQYCFEVKPGEGRLAKCLQEQLVEQQKSENTDTKVTEACKTELDDFLIDRSENINADIPLAKACAADAEKLCKNLEPGTSVLACLREQKESLSSECNAEVFERQAVAANDWRTDVELYTACETDALQTCANVSDHDGQKQACLKEHRVSLSWDCQEELFRQEVENADDMRLSVRLFKACLGDKKKFCPDVQPGNARAKECLEEHREEKNFTSQCKTEIEKMMSERAADFRLDAKLRQLCKDDIEEICPYDKDSLDNVIGNDARVIECLQDYRDEIANEGCKARVAKIMEYASSDIRFDVPLANACYEDRQDFCANVPPGSARVIRCLQERREDLSYECRATLFDQEVNMSENIDFQFPMKKACGTAISQFCKDIPHGHARVIRCLQDNKDNSAMPQDCKNQIANYTTKTATDYRLNYRLTVACQDSIQEKCADACSSSSIEQPCGGTVLKCLTEKVEEITSEDCKKEVFYFQKMEVQDFRNDVILAETCRNDVDQYCAKVEAGEGRVHKCLWDNKDKISKACRAEEIKIQIMQSSNTELMPNLAKACKAERGAHCKGVRPGKSRVYNCLLTNSDSVDFTEACKEQLMGQQAKRVRDYRMDYDLRIGCKNDVPKVCAGEFKEEDKETGAVLSCLIRNVDAVSDQCSREISGSVRGTLQLYQPGLPIVGVCDDDVKTKCLEGKTSGTQSVGEIRKCLKKYVGVPTPPGSTRRRSLQQEAAAAENEVQGDLATECASLVRLAEPGDAFGAFTASMNASAIASSVKSIEYQLGLKEGTLTPRDSSSALTLTGWSAMLGVLAVIAVIIGGAVWGYRRYHGLDGPKGYIKVHKGKVPQANGL